MRTAVISLAAIVFFTTQSAIAQPLSGNYTVGGTLPDFAALQDAANALKSEGVSGPTFFNIRPGTYTENGGNNTVLTLDSIVAGLSAANRITFQPDVSAGGNADNVILEMNRIDACASDPILVFVRLDFVTLRNLTFQHVDSLVNACGSMQLIKIGDIFPAILDDFILDGCKLIGSLYGPQDGSRGTGYGLRGDQTLGKATITNNTFDRIRFAVFLDGGNNGTAVIEDNEVYAGYGDGTAILVAAESASVKRNYVDFMGGSATAGINVSSASVAFIEQNIVMNASGLIIYGIRSLTGSGITPDSIIIANNIVSGNNGGTTTGMYVDTPNTRILHNTITNPPAGILTGLTVAEENCTVLNNIILNGSASFFGVVIDLGQANSSGLVSDHNILFFSGNGNFALHEGALYPSLTEYQDSTGLDTNSVFKEVEFIVDSLGLHLDECQSQDQDLIGIPLPQVQVDFFGAPRDSEEPFIGAVEGTPLPFDMFAAPFKISLPGTPFSVTAGRFDNLLADGLAVPDYDNSQVRLYHNNSSTRTFTHTGTLSTGFQPVVVKFFDVDDDGHLDLVAGGESSSVTVFWGDGVGGFPEETTVGTMGRVSSLDEGAVGSLNLSTILITQDNGFLPNSSFLGFLNNGGGRNIFHQVVQRPGPCCLNPDTILAVLNDFVVGDLDGNGDPELAALTTIPLPPSVYVFNDTNAQGGGGLLSYGTHYVYQLGTGSLTDASSIVAGDFDGDLDEDFITTGASENQCMLVRNQGGFSFTAEPIPTIATRAIVALDYENDGDLDLVAANRSLETEGFTVFLNDGSGSFAEKRSCFFPFASGEPSGIVAADFDLDGKTDIAVTTFLDSVFVLYNLGGGISSVGGQPTAGLPTQFSLLQNYPNPFNPSTRIGYSLPVSGHVTLKIYDLLGQEVVTLVDGIESAGERSTIWNAQALSSGIYFYRIEARSIATNQIYREVKKMMVVK